MNHPSSIASRALRILQGRMATTMLRGSAQHAMSFTMLKATLSANPLNVRKPARCAVRHALLKIGAGSFVACVSLALSLYSNMNAIGATGSKGFRTLCLPTSLRPTNSHPPAGTAIRGAGTRLIGGLPLRVFLAFLYNTCPSAGGSERSGWRQCERVVAVKTLAVQKGTIRTIHEGHALSREL
jgi:hypothetical protein